MLDLGMNRRGFLKAASFAAGVQAGFAGLAMGQDKGDRPARAAGVEVLNPQGRVPVSLIIDDATCLVNMAYYGIPQFAEVFPAQYKQDWRKLPREIPDDFVRKFGNWCGEHGIRGKYSIVPYPACVGWVDRFLPGWTERQLHDSLKLVRELMMPNWDIHPEMISHTRIIDTKTGRPFPDATPRYMENWQWTDGRSVDEMTDYMAYALQILKNAGLECEGITTPGGFGNGCLPALAQGTLNACRDVFKAEIPHYFRHMFTDDRSVAPRVEYASGLDTDDPRCVVSIIGCAGDWFGGWDGLEPGSADKFIAPDLKTGRMVDVIEKGEPAIIVCHWPGVYFNGEETGFNIFKEVVGRLHERYDCLIWMKLCEISRYWAARELTRIEPAGPQVRFNAPFTAKAFTVKVKGGRPAGPRFGDMPLRRVNDPLRLESGTWVQGAGEITACFDLPKGPSVLVL